MNIEYLRCDPLSLVINNNKGVTSTLTLTKAATTQIIFEKNNLLPPETKKTMKALLEIIKSTLIFGDSIMMGQYYGLRITILVL